MLGSSSVLLAACFADPPVQAPHTDSTTAAQKAIDILNKDKAPDESAIRNAQQIIDSSK